jgi:hypothetical protein
VGGGGLNRRPQLLPDHGIDLPKLGTGGCAAPLACAASGPHRRVASPFRAAEDCVQKVGLMTRPCTTKMLGEKPACTGAGTSVE